jgi:hypothetical protein
VRWDGTAWLGDQALSGSGHAREPAAVVDGTAHLWVAWAARDVAGGPWRLRGRTRYLGGVGWSGEADLVAPPPPGTDGDREPALAVTGPGNPVVFFRSDRGGGADLWTARVGDPPARAGTGAAADSWPAVLRLSGAIWLLHRSDRSVSLAGVGRGRGADIGVRRRYAGTTTVVPRDLDRLRATGTWEDLLSYTPHRPDVASPAGLADDQPYTRGTVGLHLTQVASGPLDEASAERLRAVLKRVVPVNVRVLVRLGPRVDIEEVYPADADLAETYADVHPDIDNTGPVVESVSVQTGWVVLHSAVPTVPPPADPASRGVTAVSGKLTPLPWRTYSPPPE